MDAQEPFSTAGVDFERANAARMYDYYLGGAHNFAADREVADRVVEQFPGVRVAVRANRTFLNNAVLVLSHSSEDIDDSEAAEGLNQGIRSYRGSATPLTSRSRAEITALLTGLDLVEPGLVDVADWPRPGTTVGPATLYGAVGVVGGHRAGPSAT